MSDDTTPGSTSASRRSLLRWLAWIPGGLVLGRVAAGCGGSGAGADAATADAGPRTDSGGGRDAGSGRDGGGRDAAGGRDGATDPDGGACAPTQDDALGPFFEEGAPMRTKLASDGEPGTPLRLEGRLLDASDCRTPLPGWGLDLWQADNEGVYYDAPDYRLRGRLVTGDDGSFSLETIKPGNYPLGGSMRPAHIHVRVYAPDGSVRLTTQIYFEGDPYLGEADPCQPPSCFSNDPERIVRLSPATIGGREGEMGMTPLFV